MYQLWVKWVNLQLTCFLLCWLRVDPSLKNLSYVHQLCQILMSSKKNANIIDYHLKPKITFN